MTERSGLDRLRQRLDGLYHGRGKAGLRFRFGLLVFDLVVVGTYIAGSFLGTPVGFHAFEILLAAVVLADLMARWLIAESTRRFLLSPFHWVDVVVLLSLLAPVIFGEFAFLRVLRALRVLRSHRVLQELRQDSRFFRLNEEIIQRSVNLVVFVFIVSATVHALQKETNPGIETYTDALYFTVAALTTTGFGDIVLEGEAGRWLSIAILIFGVGLFLQLLQSVFRPPKIRKKCRSCGLMLHDPDAIHCKHCGASINIETEGG